MSTSTLAPSTVAAFPRVDLLPPEIAEERRFRSIRALLGLAVVLTVIAVGGLYYLSHSRIADAQAGVDAAQQRTTLLQAQINKFAYVPKVYAQVSAAQAELTLATGTEVNYSYVLNDISLTAAANRNVYLSGLQIAQSSGAQGATGDVGIGTVEMDGSAVAIKDVATWLDSLAATRNFGDAYLGNVQKGVAGVQFRSQALLMPSALANPTGSK